MSGTKYEYRLIWNRGDGNRYRMHQTLRGAQHAAERLASAHVEMEWLDPPLKPLIAPVTIQRRTVSDWEILS